MSLDKDQYHAGDMALVTVANGLTQSISTADHKTNCTIVVLEHMVNGSWQAVNLCRLLTPTRLIDMAAGSTSTQKIGIPDATGLYRVAFAYGQIVYSPTFSAD